VNRGGRVRLEERPGITSAEGDNQGTAEEAQNEKRRGIEDGGADEAKQGKYRSMTTRL